MASLILFNKPFGVLSQFTDTRSDQARPDQARPDQARPTLAKYIKLPNVYPAGRLDHDSEGLLLLTDDGQLQHQIGHPAHKLAKTYWVQVEGAPNSYALTKLRQGVELNDGITLPAEARLIPPPSLWERNPPIRQRQNIPTQWLEIVISEGKNRQIRRMTAAVGHPTLRLVRVKIGTWDLTGIAQGEYKIVNVHLPKSSAVPAKRQRNNRPAAARPSAARPSAARPSEARPGVTKPASATAKLKTTTGKVKSAATTNIIIKPSKPSPP